MIIDYTSPETLQFALRSIDTIVSTVTGSAQMELIRAAVRARVRRFAPAEFEGLPQLRAANDPLDRGRAAARQLLAHYSPHIQSTAFICGILYERFQPGGLAQSRIGMSSGISAEGSYMIDCRNMTAQVPAYDSNNSPTATICMTAAQDVARFVTLALDLCTWPPELRMYGQRVLVKDLVTQVQRLKGTYYEHLRWTVDGGNLNSADGGKARPSPPGGIILRVCAQNCRLQLLSATDQDSCGCAHFSTHRRAATISLSRT